MEDSKETECLKKEYKRLRRLAELNRKVKEKNKQGFIKQYIKEWKPRMKYVLEARATRQYESSGLGFCRAAGIYGFNLMDDIIAVYVDSHYLACIALCRSRTELVLRDYIYFRWFLDNKKKDIQNYLDVWVKQGYDDDYLSTGTKYENLTNRLVFEYFEYRREMLNTEFNSLSYGKRKRVISDSTLGGLIKYCENKELLGKLMLRKLNKMKDDGNYFVHNKHIRPKPPGAISFGRPRFYKDPKKSALGLIRLTTYFMNNIFGDYPYKVLRPKENLFSLNFSDSFVNRKELGKKTISKNSSK